MNQCPTYMYIVLYYLHIYDTHVCTILQIHTRTRNSSYPAWNHGRSRHFPTCLWKGNGGPTELCPYKTRKIETLVTNIIVLVVDFVGHNLSTRTKVNQDHHPNADVKSHKTTTSLTPYYHRYQRLSIFISLNLPITSDWPLAATCPK